MEALSDHLNRRLRNQVGNLLLFGSLIGFTAAGLVGGAVTSILVVGHTALHAAPALVQLLIVVLGTASGLTFGASLSLFVSPFVLRHAFFATPVGEWNGVPIYVADDADLPGGHPNVFVSGFSLGFGPFRPSIFAARSAFKILSREALEAVFAHEISHLECAHLRRRIVAGIGTFLLASFLTSILLIGVHWSGYAEIGGALSAMSGILPAILTWLTIRQLLYRQEFEADFNAMKVHGIAPETLIGALESLQHVIGGEAHPLVVARIAAARARIPTLPKATPLPLAA